MTAKYIAIPAKGFLTAIEKLSQLDRIRVFKTVYMLSLNPFYPSLRTKKLKGTHGYYASSVNMDIRIIWEFQNGRIIFMADVGHHDILNKY
jgi:mRNA-degrading endonuclease YafQ of YafQ-DinJ toxin-antitoxin module